MLSGCIQSIKRQTDNDCEQIFIVDRERKGIQQADKSFVNHTHRVDGDFCYIVDDDCWLIDDRFVERTKAFIQTNNYPVLTMIRSKRPPGPPTNLTVFPTKEVWGKTPKHQTTNCLCYIVRSDIWKKNIGYFGIRDWGGDWTFLARMLELGHKPYWLDSEPLAESRQLGRGKLFEPATKGWFERVATQEGLECLGGDDWRLRAWKK
jgi:hypothetical protein